MSAAVRIGSYCVVGYLRIYFRVARHSTTRRTISAPCEIEVRENPVVGINVGLAVGCKENWGDIPKSSGIAGGQRVNELPAAGVKFDAINRGGDKTDARNRQKPTPVTGTYSSGALVHSTPTMLTVQ